MTAPTTIDHETQIRRAAAYELCRQSFADFLRYCRIQDDDPTAPTDIPFVPYDYQRERAEAWQSGQSEVVLKARQLGFSWTLADYMLWRAEFHGWDIGYYSRGEDEARAEIEQRVLWTAQRLPAWMVDARRIRQRDTFVRFPGGGSIRAFPSTASAGIGYTFQLVVADECAFHAYGAQNYAAYRPTLSAGGQYIACSTADPSLGPSGFFYELWQGASDGSNGYTPVFVPWHARPSRDAAWLARERAAYRGMADEFDAYYPERPEDAFVGKAGLVYPQFSRERHVRDGDPCLWEECISRYAGYDLGGGDPTAIVVLGGYRASDGSRRVHQFGEWGKTTGAPTVEEMAEYLLPWHERARFDHIERDPVGVASTIAQSLRSMYTLPVGMEPVSRDKGERLQTQAWWLDSGLLTINSACVYSIAEFAYYRWREATDPNDKTRYKTSVTGPTHGDWQDARGQALIRVYVDEMNAMDYSQPAYSGVTL